MRRKHNNQNQMKKPPVAKQAATIKLREGEIAFCLNPDKPSEVESYLLPDGSIVKAKPNEKRGIPSIIHPNLIVTSAKTQGFRPTLASRLGEMLLLAENLFGQRDRSFAFLGIEYTEDYPHLHFEANKSIILRLHLNALLEPLAAYAEMAHECIHLLSPSPKKPVTILEEGMAEVFAYIYMRDTMRHEISPKTPGTAYHEASELVAMLMTIDPYGIKRMREEEPTISLISKSLIWKHYPTLQEGIAARLARTFVQDGCTDAGILAWYEKEAP